MEYSTRLLISSAIGDTAKYFCINAENIAYLIEKYGKMPNGNSTGFLNRSQPPFFSQMVRDIFEMTRDTTWLKKIYPTVEKEYYFWQKNRKTSSGLNRYYCDDEGLFNRETAGWLCERCRIPPVRHIPSETTTSPPPDKKQSSIAA